jgi:hypothetical protein
MLFAELFSSSGLSRDRTFRSHHAKAIDEEIERRQDASPACQKSNGTSWWEMLDYWIFAKLSLDAAK